MRRGKAAATLTAVMVVFALIAAPVLGQAMATLVEDALIQGILGRYRGQLFAPHVQLGSASVLLADLRNNLVFVEIDDPDLAGLYLPALLPLESNTLQYGAAARLALRENPVTIWHEVLHHQISLRGGEECGPEEAYNFLQEARVSWLDGLRRFEGIYRDTVADAAGCPRILSAWDGRERLFHAQGLNGPFSGLDPHGACGPAGKVYVIDDGFIALWDQRLNIHFDLGDIRYAYAEKLDACAATVDTDVEALLVRLRQDRDRAVPIGAQADDAYELATGRLDTVATNLELLEASLRRSIAALDVASRRDLDHAAATVADLTSKIAQDLADAREDWQNASDFADEACDAPSATEAMDDATASEQSAERAGQHHDTAKQRLGELELIAREFEVLAQQVDDATVTLDDAVGQIDRLDSMLLEADGEIASLGEAAAALLTIEQSATGTHMEIAAALQAAPIEPGRASAIQSEANALILEIRLRQQRRVAGLHDSLVSRHREAGANVDRVRRDMLEALREIEGRVGPDGFVLYGVDEQVLVEARSNTSRIGNYAGLAARRRDDGLRCAGVFDDPDDDDSGDDSGSDDPSAEDPSADDPGDTGDTTVNPSVGDPADDDPGDDSTRDFSSIDANLEQYRRVVADQEGLAGRVRFAATSSIEKLRSAGVAIDGHRKELEEVRTLLGRLDLPPERAGTSVEAIRTAARNAINEALRACGLAEAVRDLDLESAGDTAEMLAQDASDAAIDAAVARDSAVDGARAVQRILAGMETPGSANDERARVRARIDASLGPPMPGESNLAAIRLIEIDIDSSRQQTLDRLKSEADSLWSRLAADLDAADDDVEVALRLRDGHEVRRRQQVAEEAVRSLSGGERASRRADLDNDLAVLRADFQSVRSDLDRLEGEMSNLDITSLRDEYEDALPLVEEANDRVHDAYRCLDYDEDPPGDDPGTDPESNPSDDPTDSGTGPGANPATGTNPFDDAADVGVGPGGAGGSPVTDDLSALVASTRDALGRCDYLAARAGIEQIRSADPNHPALADLSADFASQTSDEMAGYQMLEEAKKYQGNLDRVVELLQGAMSKFQCPKPEINQAIAAVVGDSAARARQDNLARTRQRQATWTSILDTVLIGAAAVDNAVNPPGRGTTGGTGGGGTGGGADAGGGTGTGTGTGSGSCKVIVWSGEGTGATDLYWVLFEDQNGTYTGYYVVPFSRERGSITPAEWARTSGQGVLEAGGSPPKQLGTGGRSAMEQAAYARCPR